MTLNVSTASVRDCIEHVGGQLRDSGAIVFAYPEQFAAMLDMLGQHYEQQVQAVQDDYSNALQLAMVHAH